MWLSFLRSVRRVGTAPLGLGSEVESARIPGDEEELFEVDRYIHGHAISLVGAYSSGGGIDLRVEQKSERSKIVVRVDYPTYGGVFAALVDRHDRRGAWTRPWATRCCTSRGSVESRRHRLEGRPAGGPLAGTARLAVVDGQC